MKTFDIYYNEYKGFKAVKKGFSWPALFFGKIWAAIEKLWALTVCYIIVDGLFVGAFVVVEENYDAYSILIILWMTIYIYMASIANNILKDHYKKQEYKKIYTISGRTAEVAIYNTIELLKIKSLKI